MIRATVPAISWILATWLLVFSSAASATPQKITLRITNTTTDTLRCAALLAHFVTRDLPQLPASESLTFDLGRNPADGSLSFGFHGTTPMLLENLLCGSTATWGESRTDVPILQLRSDPRLSFHITCKTKHEKLLCKVD